jgi:hypothetical protein
MTRSMTSVKLLSVAVFATSLFCAFSAAQAQTRVFVAAQGSDGNPCTFAAPCRTFQHAHDVVAANGEIDVLDPAGYGTLVISKAISIQGHDFSGMTVGSGGTGIVINAGINDVVHLRGIIIEGAGVGQNGIYFITGKALTIDSVVVRNFTGSGIALGPTVVTAIAISNTYVSRTGINGINTVSGCGIYVQPGPVQGQIVTAIFNRVEVYGSGGHGICIFGDLSTNSFLRATLIDSVAAHNASAGLAALSTIAGGAITDVEVTRCTFTTNGAAGIASSGSFITVRVGQSTLANNSGAFSGSVESYGDNYTGGLPAPFHLAKE